MPGEVAAFVVTPDSKEALIGTTDGAIHRVLLPNLAIKQSQMGLDPPHRVEKEGARSADNNSQDGNFPRWVASGGNDSESNASRVARFSYPEANCLPAGR